MKDNNLIDEWLKYNKPTQVKRKVNVLSDEQKEFRLYIKKISELKNKWKLGRKALKFLSKEVKKKEKEYMLKKFKPKVCNKSSIMQMSFRSLLISSIPNLRK